MAGTTILEIPAALGLHGKSLQCHLSNQMKCLKSHLTSAEDVCSHGETVQPFWKAHEVHETCQRQDRGWVSPAHLLDWPGCGWRKTRGRIKPLGKKISGLFLGTSFRCLQTLKCMVCFISKGCFRMPWPKHQGHTSFIHITAAVTSHWLNQH